MNIKRILIFTVAFSIIGGLASYAILSKPSAYVIDDGIVTTKMERIVNRFFPAAIDKTPRGVILWCKFFILSYV